MNNRHVSLFITHALPLMSEDIRVRSASYSVSAPQPLRRTTPAPAQTPSPLPEAVKVRVNNAAFIDRTTSPCAETAR